MRAWNGWYHVNGNTYGTWLPGDPRGWRVKRHRRHVEGDYNNPPPAGSGTQLHTCSKDLLREAPVHLTPTQREIVGRALVEMLTKQGIEVLDVAVTEVHFHLLARFLDGKVKPRVGRAKKHAWHSLHDQGFTGKLWGHESHPTPINDRQHQLNVFYYIQRHREQGAWVWDFRQGLYWLEDESALPLPKAPGLRSGGSGTPATQCRGFRATGCVGMRNPGMQSGGFLF